MNVLKTNLAESTMNTPINHVFLDTDDHFPDTRPSEAMVEQPHDLDNRHLLSSQYAPERLDLC